MEAKNDAWPALDDLCRKLDYVFKNPDFVILALTHSSWANEKGHGGRHNERLEFLGDAALELCVSAELFRRFPDAREGELTRMRSRLVSEKSLAEIARQTGINRAIRLGDGEEAQGGRERAAILCDAFEAVLAAVYVDGGFAAAAHVVEVVFKDRWGETGPDPAEADFKSRLQEVCQRLFHNVPVYALEGSSGPDHARVFTARLDLPNGQTFYASNTSRKKAEMDAAAQALATLEK